MNCCWRYRTLGNGPKQGSKLKDKTHLETVYNSEEMLKNKVKNFALFFRIQ